MVTPSEGALGGIDFSEEQRRELAEKSRAKEVNFTFGSEKRREVTRLVHEKMLGRMGKAKQAARKMAREKREREEKDARERSDGGNGTNAEAPTTSTATLEQQQQQQQTPSPTPSPRNAANNENNENDDDVQRQRNSRTTQTTTRSIERRPASPEQQQQQQQQRRQQRDLDHRTSAIKLLDSISVCLIVAIVAILLKRCMWIPPSL
jgi:cobalamin biosynthesis Mg chelatase CobN